MSKMLSPPQELFRLWILLSRRFRGDEWWCTASAHKWNLDAPARLLPPFAGMSGKPHLNPIATMTHPPPALGKRMSRAPVFVSTTGSA